MRIFLLQRSFCDFWTKWQVFYPLSLHFCLSGECLCDITTFWLSRISEPIGATHTQGHILGTHFIVRARQDPASESSLREACLVIGLRQDIFISFVTQRSLRPLAGYCHIDRSIAPADDWTWAHRIIAHCADVLNYCYGDKPHDVETWKALKSYADSWDSLKPASFTPIKDTAAGQSKGQIFPEKWYLNDCHSMFAMTG